MAAIAIRAEEEASRSGGGEDGRRFQMTGGGEVERSQDATEQERHGKRGGDGCRGERGTSQRHAEERRPRRRKQEDATARADTLAAS